MPEHDTTDGGRGDRRTRASRSRRVRAVLTLGVVLGLGGIGTLAQWSDESTATAEFSTGTVAIRLTDANRQAYEFTDLSMSGMAPGNSKAATVKVKNTGTLPFTYTVGGSVTNQDGKGLGTALQVTVKVGATVGGSGKTTTCSGGTVVSSGSSLNGKIVSSARSLPAAQSETLCFQVTLPSSAGTGLQGASSTATLTFAATNG